MTKQDYERLAKAAVAIREEFAREMRAGFPNVLVADRPLLVVLHEIVIDQLALACADRASGNPFEYTAFRKACKANAPANATTQTNT